MRYRLENPDNNEWLNKANALIDKYEYVTKTTYPGVKLSLHHILIRSLYPDLAKDKNNIIYMAWQDHWLIHYYMWKADRKYCAAFWFCYVYFKKHYNMKITSDEEKQLKSDMAYYKQHKGDK